MNNKEFIAALAKRSGYKNADTQKIVQDVIAAMSANFEEGEPVWIPGFGTFEVKKRLERVMVNPASGLRMLVPPKLVLNFKPISAVKEKIRKGGEV